MGRVAVKALILGESPRVEGENLEHIRMMAELDTPLPPILVDRTTMRVVDGAHRLKAAMLRGDDSIEVEFFDGSAREAFVKAVQLNVAHGMPLSLTARKAAALKILGWFPEWSGRRIADTSGLSAGTVSSLRSQMGRQPDRRLGRDGRMRPVDCAEGRARAEAILASQPTASLREVARIAGISPGTVRNVRLQLLRDEETVPRRDEARREESDSVQAATNQRQVRASRSSREFVDSALILSRLSSDPSLRYTESGKALLRWLTTRCIGPRGWQNVIHDLPPHCRQAVAKLARACALDWERLAMQLEEDRSFVG